jgi:hypothetical protein
MKILSILVALFFSACASDFAQFNIKQNGKIKNINVKSSNDSFLTSKNYSFTNKSNLSIRFKNISPELIQEFENRYDLKLQSILIIGDYIYSHNSEDIIALIEDILNESDNIHTITPLWQKSANRY